MTPAPLVADEEHGLAVARSRVYAFLASLFNQPPQEPLLRLLADESGEEADGLRELFGDGLHAELASGAREALASPESLARDFDALLRIPQDRYLAPYESAYRGTPARKTRGMGLLMGRQTREVAALYRMAGVALGGECKELPDHVAVELQFLADCASQEAEALLTGQSAEAEGWRGLQSRFQTEHVMQWVPAMCRRMEQQASTGFFRAVARVLPEVLGRDLEARRAECPPSAGPTSPV